MVKLEDEDAVCAVCAVKLLITQYNPGWQCLHVLGLKSALQSFG